MKKVLDKNGEMSIIEIDGEYIGSGTILRDATDDDVQLYDMSEKNIAIHKLYNTMVSDIYTQMESVFGTRNDASAQAYASTWEAMLARPANYVNTDLGLADEQAVIDYATEKLNAADAYAVYRMNRIKQYEADKAAL